MIRLVVFVLVATVVGLLLVEGIRRLKHAAIDWTGVSAIIGFIVLAFYLRHVTGMG